MMRTMLDSIMEQQVGIGLQQEKDLNDKCLYGHRFNLLKMGPTDGNKRKGITVAKDWPH
jgi:hypothetical protein